uniref:ZP domain-containing protein n=1 Tax=Mesocestoides corti TaxID=53468 RepID=A0A5K3FYA5_MESCO
MPVLFKCRVFISTSGGEAEVEEDEVYCPEGATQSATGALIESHLAVAISPEAQQSPSPPYGFACMQRACAVHASRKSPASASVRVTNRCYLPPATTSGQPCPPRQPFHMC